MKPGVYASCVLAAGLLWSLAGLADGAAPLVLAELRLLGGGALLVLYCGPARCLRLLLGASRAGVIGAAAGMVLFQWCLFEAYARCGLAFTALVSTGASPLCADLFETSDAKWRTRGWRAAVLLCGGALLLAIVLGAVPAAGALLATLSAAGYALYAAASKSASSSAPADDALLSTTALALAVAGIALLPAAGPALGAFGVHKHLGLAAFLAIAATALPYVLFVKGLRGMAPGDALTLLNIQPAAALLLALAAGQRVPPAYLATFTLMTAAMLLRSRSEAITLST